jgi:hypothetical protein
MSQKSQHFFLASSTARAGYGRTAKGLLRWMGQVETGAPQLLLSQAPVISQQLGLATT